MQGAFDSDHVPKNFLLERKLPSRETRGLLLKMSLFLSVQMHQAAIIKISMTKG
jgi:hypothetical protein